MGLRAKTGLPRNPQSSATLERIHQILADCLRTFEMEDADVEELIEKCSIPKLTARRLRKALIEIGAKIEA